MGPVAYFGLSDDFFPNDMNSYRGTRMPHEQCIVPGMIRCDDCACLKLVFEIKLMLRFSEDAPNVERGKHLSE